MLRISALTLSISLWSPAAAQQLPILNLDPTDTTVSGLSSGAFMAVQVQVAFSNSIAGAGIVAGGPFNCARQSIWRALYVCMDPFFLQPDPESSVESVQALASQGRIDPVEGLVQDKVYLFHGEADDTVARVTMDALDEVYMSLGIHEQAIEYVTDVDAGHGFVTEQGPIACAETRPDFLIDCDLDQAGDILTHLYGPLTDPISSTDDNLLVFDQSMYIGDAIGMDHQGFAYVPDTCADGEVCRLHIALHGCNQGREVVGEDFVRLTGFNRWAEVNRIVVLYPQAASIPSPWYNWFGGNPNGCWDWWGYSGSDYLSRSAPQIAAIASMAAAIGAPLDQ
jgi:poly(3-hydroxybutyrate) depolymerase